MRESNLWERREKESQSRKTQQVQTWCFSSSVPNKQKHFSITKITFKYFPGIMKEVSLDQMVKHKQEYWITTLHNFNNYFPCSLTFCSLRPTSVETLGGKRRQIAVRAGPGRVPVWKRPRAASTRQAAPCFPGSMEVKNQTTRLCRLKWNNSSFFCS